MDFLQELAGYNRFNDENASHHDAESIFWVILFFMVRANPKGPEKNISIRSETFDAIVGHKIGGFHQHS